MPDSPPPTPDLALRQCLGRFATGVTVVTCRDARGHPCGITANSFSSVSLEPPLVLWNIAKVSHSLEAFLNADTFAINVLAERQRDVAIHFARPDHRLFDGVAFEDGSGGAPLLDGTLAHIECRRHQVHDAGDHYIIIGEIVRHDSVEGDPLLFFSGQYTEVAKPD
ncbi:MAG: flavin reductase family protein [Woeseiaceae bacterium]|nr:flavin reductase family protein [Woeseiaceae bacterium]